MRRRHLLATIAASVSAPALARAVDASSRALIVATSTAGAGASGRRTGLDLMAYAEAFWLLRGAGLAVDLATVDGRPPPIDPATGNLTGLPMALRMDPDALRAFGKPRRVEAASSAPYAVVLLAPGRGALWDFPADASLGRLIAEALAAGRPIAALDHGVAGLLALSRAGQPAAAGRRVTCPTDAEERAAGWAGAVPFSLEARLREAGAEVDTKGVLLEHAVRDGPLVTGQNVSSVAAAVRLLLQAVRAGPD